MPTTTRVEEYIKNGGRSSDKKDAIVVNQNKLIGLALWLSTRIPPQFFVGTAKHESEFIVNKIVTDNGTTFKGLFQLTDASAGAVGMPNADLFSAFYATTTAVFLYEKRLDVIITEALKKQTTIKDEDVWAYLAIANNQGPAAAVASISKYGLNWESYKERNPKSKFVLSGYGDDVITGGSTWKCPC